ncbi:hypothetical protein HDU91_006043 [Kappamyces sp. JEL0680]|nr:hypothetical protein HDU91_006043 [Kappamyces sp. JEL0680]
MCFMALLLVSVKLAVVSWSSIISYYFILNWTFGLWFVSVAIAFGESARYVYIPYFILGHLVVVNLRGIFQSMNRMNSMSISTNRQTFWVILSTILVFVYVGSCALNYCETRFRSLVITFTTVGYGDLTPKTVPGQIIIIVQLGLAIILLPGLLNELLERIQKEASGGGSFSRGWNSFVVLCGDFQQVKKTDEVRGEVTTVVLLARRPLPSDLAYRIREYRRRRKVTYILGSGLEPKDLERVQLNFAKAIFVLAKYQSEDAFHEDEHNGLRVWAFDKYAPNVPLYAETRLPDSVELFEDMTSGAICLTSSMQIFLAYSALYRGVGTLLINLLRGTTHLQYDREKQAPWLDYYMDGINNEIYKAPINPIFIGMNFASVSEYLYRHFQVIMFACHVYIPERNVHHVVLNPGSKYILKPGDHSFYMARHYSDVKAISNLSMQQYSQTRVVDQTEDPAAQMVISVPSIFVSETNQALVRGYPTIHDSGKVPFCWLSPEPSSWPDPLLRDADHLSGHFLICTGNYHLFRLISTLRSAHLERHEVIPILILCAHQPTEHEFFRFSSFPFVYFMVGFAHKASHLQKAGLLRATRVVIANLNKHHCRAEEESDLQMLDSKVVTISNMMNRLFRDHGIVNSPIVELMSETNSAFLAPGSTEFVPRYQRLSRQEQAQRIKPTREYVLSPMFAAGSVLSPAMIESVLTNAYHQPSILNLFNCFAGIRYRVDVEIDAYLNLEGAGTLSCIQVPQEYVGKTFGSLYRGLVRSHGIVPIGLLRDKLSSLRNPLPFVYTNPISCLLLLSHDLVYILGDKTAIMAPLIK